MQPRLGGGSGGKSNDEIVYELSESILEKIIEKLDIDEAKQEMFEPDDKGRMKSLTTVLTQEVDRFNKLLKVVKVKLQQDTPRIEVLILWIIVFCLAAFHARAAEGDQGFCRHE